MYKGTDGEEIVYIITQGIAQHTGRQTGTTALPELLFSLYLLLSSYSYFAFAFAFMPPPLCNTKHNNLFFS